jgi:hypothetical protein
MEGKQMKLGYVIFRIIGDEYGHEMERYVVNPARVAFQGTEDPEDAMLFEFPRDAYVVANIHGLQDWKVGLR